MGGKNAFLLQFPSINTVRKHSDLVKDVPVCSFKVIGGGGQIKDSTLHIMYNAVLFILLLNLVPNIPKKVKRENKNEMSKEEL